MTLTVVHLLTAISRSGQPGIAHCEAIQRADLRSEALAAGLVRETRGGRLELTAAGARARCASLATVVDYDGETPIDPAIPAPPPPPPPPVVRRRGRKRTIPRIATFNADKGRLVR